jgi:hypothetical protein
VLHKKAAAAREGAVGGEEEIRGGLKTIGNFVFEASEPTVK